MKAMKTINVLVAIIFAMSLCLAYSAGDSYAASATKDVAASAKKAAELKPGSVGINTADKEMLTQLPGVGPKTADAIIAYREANGKFKSVDDLVNVKGIGEKTLAKIKPFVKL
jgi:competence protein ComEA